MRRFQYTERFKHAYDKLDEAAAAQVDNTLRILLADPRHPGLRTKRVQGTHRIWETGVGRSFRLTFEMEGDLLILRNVGPHDRTLKNP